MLKLIQMASAKVRLTANCDTKYRESRSPASLSARVAERMSVAPATRMKRSRSDSYSSNTKMRTRSTMPANWIGCQTVVRSFHTSSKGWDSNSGGGSAATPGAAPGGERSTSWAETGGTCADWWIPVRRLVSLVSLNIGPTVTSSKCLELALYVRFILRKALGDVQDLRTQRGRNPHA